MRICKVIYIRLQSPRFVNDFWIIRSERKIGYQVFQISIQLHKNLPDFFKIKQKNIRFQINLSDYHNYDKIKITIYESK